MRSPAERARTQHHREAEDAGRQNRDRGKGFSTVSHQAATRCAGSRDILENYRRDLREGNSAAGLWHSARAAVERGRRSQLHTEKERRFDLRLRHEHAAWPVDCAITTNEFAFEQGSFLFMLRADPGAYGDPRAGTIRDPQQGSRAFFVALPRSE